MRDWLLFFHILGAAGWIGGGLHAWFVYTGLARDSAGSGQALATLTKSADKYFGPVAGVTLLTGIALVWSQDPWAWNDTFVLIGIGVFVFSAVWQPLVSSKVEARLLAKTDGGADASEEIKGFHRSTAVDLLVVLVALWAMVTKIGS